MARTEKEADEYLEIVNHQGEIVGRALRSVCHGHPELIHRVSHVLVFNEAGLILLQKRSASKDIQPGKWDSSVGGHLAIGETFEEAAYREMAEELSIRNVPIFFLYDYLIRTPMETELVRTFSCCFNGPIFFNEEEIEEVKFWDLEYLHSQIETDLFTPHLREEIYRYFSWKKLINRSWEKE